MILYIQKYTGMILYVQNYTGMILYIIPVRVRFCRTKAYLYAGQVDQNGVNESYILKAKGLARSANFFLAV